MMSGTCQKSHLSKECGRDTQVLRQLACATASGREERLLGHQRRHGRHDRRRDEGHGGGAPSAPRAIVTAGEVEAVNP